MRSCNRLRYHISQAMLFALVVGPKYKCSSVAPSVASLISLVTLSRRATMTWVTPTYSPLIPALSWWFPLLAELDVRPEPPPRYGIEMNYAIDVRLVGGSCCSNQAATCARDRKPSLLKMCFT